MSLIEFIGFVISMGAMVFLIGRHFWEAMIAKKDPERGLQEKRAQKDTLKQFLKSLDIDMDEDEEQRAPPPQPHPHQRPKPVVHIKHSTPPPKPVYQSQQEKHRAHRVLQDSYSYKDSIENYRLESTIEHRKMKNAIDNRYNYSNEHIVSPDLQDTDYHMIQNAQPSRVKELVSKAPSLKGMIVFQEIMNLPRAYRPYSMYERH